MNNSTPAGEKLGFMSAKRISAAVENFGEGLLVLLQAFIRSGGMIALFIADTVAGGLVGSAMFAQEPSRTTTIFAWSISAGLSAITMAVWSMVMTREHGISLMPLSIGIIATAIDWFWDGRLPTMWLYGTEIAEATWFAPPNASPLWYIESAVVLIATVCADAAILLIRLSRGHGVLDRIPDRALRAATVPATA